jgi:hypothetical protein
LRSVSKRLGIYMLLDSLVFSGIDADVKGRLNFIFQDKPVEDLQQLIFLIANSGERAISNVIEPLAFTLPSSAEVLDISILHRSPADLATTIGQSRVDTGGTKVELISPLMNKGDFFVVKLLLSGRLETRGLRFSILADDIPRTLRPERLPPDAVMDKKYRVEWGLIAVSIFLLLVPVWSWCILKQVYKFQPGFLPYPWSTFVASLESVFVLIFGGIFLFLTTFTGLGMFLAALFNGQFPPRRGPRFPLPKEMQGLFSPIGGLFEPGADLKIEKN